MTKTSNKSSHIPKYKNKSKTEKLKLNSSSTLPSNLLNFRQELLPGNGFIPYKQFYI